MCPCGVANTCNCFLATERESSADELQRLRAEVAYCVGKENELREANAALAKRNLALQADALRYQWLRDSYDPGQYRLLTLPRALWAEAIDSAIEEAKK